MPPNFSPLRAHHPACSLKRESLNPPATPDHDELTSRGDQGCQMSPFSYSRFPLQGSLTQKRQWHQPANWKKKIGSFFSSKTSPNLTITPLLSLSPWLLSLQHEPTFWCCSIYWELSPQLLQPWARCIWLLREQRDNLHHQGNMIQCQHTGMSLQP